MGFFSDIDEVVEPVKTEKKGGYFSDLTDKPKKTAKQEFKFAPENLARGAGAAIISTPRTVTGLLKYGSQQLAEKGRLQAKEEEKELNPEQEKFTDFLVKGLGYPEELLEKIGLPTFQEVSDWARSKTEQNEFEVSDIEKGLETTGNFLGTAALTPGASFRTGMRGATTAAGAVGAGGAEALGAGPGGQFAASLGLPAAVNMLNLIRKGKLMPTGKEALALYNFLKAEGLSEAELAPILQSSRKSRLLGGLAQKTGRAKKAIEASESALGRVYDKIKQAASHLPRATTAQETRFVHRLQDISNNLKKSKIKGPGKTDAIKKIDDMIHDVAANGISADEIIATWIDVNDAIDWKSFKTGKKTLASIKEPMMDLFKEISPHHAREFANVNKSYSRLQNVAKVVEPNNIRKLISYGEGAATAYGVYEFITTGDTKKLKGIAFTKGVRHLATEMLINPRLNNLSGKLLIAIKSGSKQALLKATRDFEEELATVDKENQE